MNLVEVKRISYYPPSKGYQVLLQEKDGDRSLPIIVAQLEAQAIALYLEGVNMPRPMTHDLMLDIIHSLDVDIKHIIISDIRNGTFFAKITMSTLASGDVTVDSRPSDAIAIGLRSMVPIFVEEVVFDSVGVIEQPESESEESLQEVTQIMEPLTSSEDMLDNLNEALNRAVEEEEYEEGDQAVGEVKQEPTTPSNQNETGTQAPEQSMSTQVIVRGWGKDKDKALKDAWRNAIEIVAGTLITAKSTIENEKLFEDIVNAHSNGFVAEYGVDKGKSFLQLCEHFKKETVFGFDGFEGLPDGIWPGNTIHKGMFDHGG